MTSSAEAFEAVTDAVFPTLAFRVEFAGIGVSLINRKMVEVIYLSVDTLKFEYTDSSVAQAVNLSCGTLQIDNQLHDALYPVILQPTPIGKESDGMAALPTVQGSIIWLKDRGEKRHVILKPDFNYSHSRTRCAFCEVLFYTAPGSNHRSG